MVGIHEDRDRDLFAVVHERYREKFCELVAPQERERVFREIVRDHVTINENVVNQLVREHLEGRGCRFDP